MTERAIYEGDYGYPILIPLKTVYDLSTYDVSIHAIVNGVTYPYEADILTSQGMSYVSFYFTQTAPALVGRYKIYVILTRAGEVRTIGPAQLDVAKVQ